MKHHVTPETALRLKQAGYPQPENRYGFIANNEGEPVLVRVPDSVPLAYCPTATEIMEQPEMKPCSIFYLFEKWFVGAYNVIDYLDSSFFCRSESTNPAEAAADVYLQIKQKQAARGKANGQNYNG